MKKKILVASAFNNVMSDFKDAKSDAKLMPTMKSGYASDSIKSKMTHSIILYDE